MIGGMEDYGLSDGQPTAARDRAVESCVVLVRANDRLHHFWRRTCRVGIKVHHRAALVAHRDRDCCGVVSLAEGQHTAQPLVLLERNRSQQANDKAVPAQVGNLESFTSHGLHGIPEDRLYLSDFLRACSVLVKKKVQAANSAAPLRAVVQSSAHDIKDIGEPEQHNRDSFRRISLRDSALPATRR